MERYWNVIGTLLERYCTSQKKQKNYGKLAKKNLNKTHTNHTQTPIQADNYEKNIQQQRKNKKRNVIGTLLEHCWNIVGTLLERYWSRKT